MIWKTCLGARITGIKKKRWRRRGRRYEEEAEELEEWEKEEMAAMWRFQGKCDVARIEHEKQNSYLRHLKSSVTEGKVRFVRKFCLKAEQVQ